MYVYIYMYIPLEGQNFIVANVSSNNLLLTRNLGSSIDIQY